jgi:hypothetical protein
MLNRDDEDFACLLVDRVVDQVWVFAGDDLANARGGLGSPGPTKERQRGKRSNRSIASRATRASSFGFCSVRGSGGWRGNAKTLAFV